LQDNTKGVTISTLSGVPKYYTFRVRGIVQGQRVTTLIDGGATHNFIDVALVTRRQIPVEDFEGFNVVVEDGYNMACTQRIRGLEVTLGNYTLTDEFYVIDLADTHVVLGVQWLYSLGDIHMNYQDMRMEF
jgi:predicted aspartyl protease